MPTSPRATPLSPQDAVHLLHPQPSLPHQASSPSQLETSSQAAQAPAPKRASRTGSATLELVCHDVVEPNMLCPDWSSTPGDAGQLTGACSRYSAPVHTNHGRSIPINARRLACVLAFGPAPLRACIWPYGVLQ